MSFHSYKDNGYSFHVFIYRIRNRLIRRTGEEKWQSPTICRGNFVYTEAKQ